jgi:hypothetical protein
MLFFQEKNGWPAGAAPGGQRTVAQPAKKSMWVIESKVKQEKYCGMATEGEGGGGLEQQEKKTRLADLNRVGGGVTPAVLPHHRAYGSVHGGS